MLFPKTLRQLFPFALAVSIAAAATISLAEMSSSAWYARLARPAWAVAPAVLPPLWNGLYAAMAIAAWQLYRKSSGFAEAQGPLMLWGVQVVLQTFWAGCFFALRNPRLGALEATLLLAASLAATLAFWRRERSAGMVMLLPTLWAAYAAALSFTLGFAAA